MDVIDLRALEEAVTVFYRSCSTEQAVAHEWLTKVQNSPQAWSFAWDLMAQDKVSFFFLLCRNLTSKRVRWPSLSVCVLVNEILINLPKAIRNTIFRRHNFALETDEILARSAKRKSRRTQTKTAGIDNCLWKWTENCAESLMHIGNYCGIVL